MTIVWEPSHPEKSRLWQFMRFVEAREARHFSDYHSFYQWSIQSPELFWPALVAFFDIEFSTPPKTILKHAKDMLQASWFDGASFNFAQQLLKRDDPFPAIVSINENNERFTLSYQELGKAVRQCAAGLKRAGITRGDRVVAIMPNTHYTIIAMLATALLGAIWSSCSPDFGAEAAIDRLSQVEPKLLFMSDGHHYLGKIHSAVSKFRELCQGLPTLTHAVICPFIGETITLPESPHSVYWQTFVNEEPLLEIETFPFAHPLYILFSSGTTGKPKCITHGAGGTLLQHVKELGLHTDIHANDNLFFYTTCGWMMWNWMVSVLALGATLTLYEGAPTYPDAYRLFELVEKEKITVFGTSAKFISAVKKANASPIQRFSLKSLRTILSTGSPLLPEHYDFVYQEVKKDLQLSSISGGTDIVSCFALGNPLLPVHRGELQCRGLGMAVSIFNEQGKAITEEKGELVCVKPFPSMPIYFWNDKDKTAYKKAYFSRFANVWAHGDFAELSAHQGLIIYGRSDAILNPGGVRIGTAEIYKWVEKQTEILDSIVIGQAWQDDVRVILFVKLREGHTLSPELIESIRHNLKHHASPRHVPAKIIAVPDIPRTLSGKLVEVAVRNAVQGEPIQNIQSLANPESLAYFKNRPELLE